MKIRIGEGYDVHKLVTERPLIIGGVTIPYEYGLAGHSDADVLVHAVIDALLGALALGDIGQWFPDTNDEFKDVNSLELLSKVLNDPAFSEWRLNNLDATVIAQSPRLEPYILEMRKNLANAFKCDVNDISIKATTTEQLGFCGRKEGIAASATILIQSFTDCQSQI